MKKVLAILMVAVMLLSLAACGEDKGGNTTGSNNAGSNNAGSNNAGSNEGTGGSGAETPPETTAGNSSASDYTAAVDNLIQVKYNGKSDDLEALAPQSFWSFYENNYSMPRDSLINEAKYTVESTKENLKYAFGESFTLTHEITKATEVSADQLSKIAAAFAEQKGVDNITAIYVLNIAVSFGGSTPGVEEFEISAARIGDNWYFVEWNIWDEGCYVMFFIEGMVSG